MAVQLTIIGLGQIGASVGLALADQKDVVLRVGHDKDPAIAKRARQLNTVDRIENNLHAAVGDADLVLLTLPMDQIKETLEQIGPDLKEGTVVMDTAPVKEVIAGWAKQYLPFEGHYVGLTPVLNPAYLHEIDAGLDAAHADLFQHGLMAIVSPPETHSEAIKLAADLTRLLGATALFADTYEMDGLMASTLLLPQLLSAALLNVTIDQPGWREGRKVAGKAYAEVSGAIMQPTTPASLAATALYNRENTLRVLDGALAALHAMRSDLQQQNEQSLAERFTRAQNGRAVWWGQRQAGDWANQELSGDVDMPRPGDVFRNLLGVRRKPKK